MRRRQTSDLALAFQAFWQIDRHADARRQTSNVRPSRRARARRQRCGAREAILKALLVRKLLRPQQLQQPEKSVRIILERRRAEEKDVTAERGNRRNRPPARVAWMPSRP